MPWAVVAAGVGVAGNAIVGSMQKRSVDSGVAAANARSEAAIGEARKLWDPFIAGGTNALTSLGDFAGLNGADAGGKAMAMFKSSPGYDYQVREGLRAVDNAAAARGMLRSGATLKAEQTLGANLANQDFTNYLGRLNSLAGFGKDAISGFGNVMSGQATNQQSSTLSGAGANASITGNTGGSITNSIAGALGNKDVQNTLTGLWNGGGSGGSTAGDVAISNPDVLGGSYFSNANPNLNFA